MATHSQLLRNLVLQAESLEDAGQWFEAATFWQKIADFAIQNYGEHSREASNAFNGLGTALLHAGDLDRAAKVLYHAWRLRPQEIDLEHDRPLYDILVALLSRINAVPQLVELMRKLVPAFDAAGSRGAFEAAVTRNTLGEMLRRLERYQEAEKVLQEAIERFEVMGETGLEGAAAAYNNLGLVYRGTGKTELGEKSCRKAVELSRAGGLSLLPIALDNHASFLRVMKRYQEAEPILEEALQFARPHYPPGSEDLQIILENIADLKEHVGKAVDAKPYLKELSSPPFDEYSQSSLKSLLALYNLLLKAEDGGESKQVGTELLRRLTSPKVTVSLAEAIRAQKRSIEETHGWTVDSKPPQSIFEELVSKHRSDVDPMILQFERQRNRGALFPEASELKPASSFLERMGVHQVITEQSIRFSHFIAERDLPVSDLIRLRDDLGEDTPIVHARARAACGQWTEALEILASAMQPGMDSVSAFLGVRVQLERARVYHSMGRFDDAIRSAEDAARQCSTLLSPSLWTEILLVAADIFDRLASREMLFAALIEALACARSQTDDQWTLHYLDLEVRSLRDPDARRELVSEKIRMIWEYLGIDLDNNITANVYQIDRPDPEGFARLVASVRSEIQLRPTEHINIDLMQRAAIAFEVRLDFINASRIWLTLSEHFLDGGNYLAYQGTMARAVRLLQNKSGDWLFDVHRLEGRHAYSQGDKASAITLLERALEVAEHTRASLSLEQERQGYFGRVAGVYRSLLNLLLEVVDPARVWTVAERASARSLLDHVADIGPQSDKAAVPDSDDLRRLMELLAPDEAVIMPILQPDGVSTLVVRSAGIETLRSPAGGSTIGNEVARFLTSLQEKETERKCIKHAHALYNHLIAPLERALQGVTGVIWVPEYDLAGLPVDCLHDGKSYLIERFSFTHCFSSTLFLRLRSAPCNSISEALVAGDPGGDLPFARQECEWLDGELRTRKVSSALFTEDAATLENVQQHLGAAHLVHLSCHGYLRVERSHIRLFSHSGSAGFLTLTAISKMKLNARLAVLTSCHAGAGSVQLGNEISGFVREFIRAGARTVVAPLWELGDRAGFELSRQFYTALFQSNSVAASLKTAKLALMRSRDLAGCAHWAPLVSFGDGR
jgi:CHAT domain-containing protein/Flp pilus assembly protein TadD